MPEVIVPAPHPATHPSRKVRTVGPLVDFHEEGQRIRVTPRYAGADPNDPWVYVLGRVRPHVELIAAGMAADACRFLEK